MASVLPPGGFTPPVIEKQTGSIGQGLKPQRRLVSCYPRPEACLAAVRAVAIELWQWVTWVGMSFKIVVKDNR